MTYMSYSGYCSNASYSIDSVVDYNAPVNNLETVLEHPTAELIPRTDYETKTYQENYAISKHKEYFSPEPFLKWNRPVARFIGKTEDIKHYIQEAFEAVTGNEMPKDIVINIVSEKELKEKNKDFGENPSAGLQGFSINGINKIIIVKENELDKLLLTIGHEIGHVLTSNLPEKLNEEAKAFAFEMAWIKALHKNNIAELQNSLNLNPMPAENGLHNIAFSFVKEKLIEKDALELFNEIANGEVKVNEVW